MSKPRVTMPAGREPTGHLLRDSVMGLVPEVLEPYIALNNTLWFDGPLSAAELEMVRLRNARKVGCVYCKAVRYDIATNAGLDETRIRQIEDGYLESTLASREKLILQYVDHYLDDPARLPQVLKDQLKAELSKEEIIHLSMALAMFNSMSRAAVAFGGMPEQELPVMAISVPE